MWWTGRPDPVQRPRGRALLLDVGVLSSIIALAREDRNSLLITGQSGALGKVAHPRRPGGRRWLSHFLVSGLAYAL